MALTSYLNMEYVLPQSLESELIGSGDPLYNYSPDDSVFPGIDNLYDLQGQGPTYHYDTDPYYTTPLPIIEHPEDYMTGIHDHHHLLRYSLYSSGSGTSITPPPPPLPSYCDPSYDYMMNYQLPPIITSPADQELDNFNSYSLQQIPFQTSKRQKCLPSQYNCSTTTFLPDMSFMPDYLLADPFPEFTHRMEDHYDHHDRVINHAVDNNNIERSVSAQSVAARERRRKITEKTQELGKLVPGGTKMNTAEMLQAGFKYVHYLQAQIAILHSMADSSYHHHQEESKGVESEREEMEALMGSAAVQEKLYLEEKCLVPHQFVKMLLANHDHASAFNPTIYSQLSQLLIT